MRYARGPLWTLQLTALLAAASASATSIRPNWLFERDGTCAANYQKCPQAGLPANFCCSTGSTCNVLAGGTTVLCCPEGGDCANIKPISCTLSLQDPVENPKASVKTTELDGKLPTCGKGCCPFGYHCDADNANCVMDKDQSKKPGQASPSVPGATPSATSKPSSLPSTSSAAHSSPTTPAGGASISATATAVGGSERPTPTSETQVTETPSAVAARTLNAAAIVGGVIGGLLFLTLLIAGFWVLRRKRRQDRAAAAEDEKQRDSNLSFGNIGSISAPIPHGDYQSQRLDFLAKAQSSSAASAVSSSTSPPPATVQTVRTIPNRFFSPNSPYSASVFGFGVAGHHRPGSAITTRTDEVDRPRSHHASAEIGGLRNLTNRYSGGSAAQDPFTPRTPRGGRLNSGGSESINIFADPSTVGSPSDYNRRDTTWTDFQHQADRRGTPSPMPPRL